MIKNSRVKHHRFDITGTVLHVSEIDGHLLVKWDGELGAPNYYAPEELEEI